MPLIIKTRNRYLSGLKGSLGTVLQTVGKLALGGWEVDWATRARLWSCRNASQLSEVVTSSDFIICHVVDSQFPKLRSHKTPNCEVTKPRIAKSPNPNCEFAKSQIANSQFGILRSKTTSQFGVL